MVLQSLLMVTVLVVDLDATIAAYNDYLGYEVAQTGVIQGACAEQMGDLSLTGRTFVNMALPEGENEVLLRFIEGASVAYKPMLAAGWSAIELLAQDPVALRNQMYKSAFSVVGEPAYLTAAKKILAMQASGPSGELLYFTKMLEPESSLLKPAAPKSPVGNTFIMVAGSRDLMATRLFLEENFKNFITNPIPFKIAVLATAREDASDTRYPIMMIKFSGPFGFEFDEYGKELDTTKVAGGIILVSASVDALTSIDSSPQINESLTSRCPGLKGRSSLVRFPSGALLEVMGP
jgi:hypothetical protein